MSEKVLITPTDVSNLTNSGACVLIDTRDPAVYAFPTQREAAAAITMARPWVARMTAEYRPELSGLAHVQSGGAEALR